MIEEWLAALEATRFISALRDSMLVYPLVNAGHVLGIGLLVGAIIPLDLRLLGTWRSLPLAPLWRVLTQTAMAGIILSAITGLLLFACDAREYLDSDLFIWKMLFVFAGVINALALRVIAPVRLAHIHAVTDKAPLRLQLAAIVSITLWLVALILGRMVGYF